MDENFKPLDEYLGPIKKQFERYNMHLMKRTHWMTVEGEFNWKIVQDNFNESYHLPFVHPQTRYILEQSYRDCQFDMYAPHAHTRMNNMTKKVHVVGGTVISIDGDGAELSTAFTSFHSIPGTYEQVGPVNTAGIDTDWIVAGRYVDQLIKVDGEWKISERRASNDWTKITPSNPS